jgi:hypothetical protein
MKPDTTSHPKSTKARVRRTKPAPVAQIEADVAATAPLGVCFSDRWTALVRHLRAVSIEANQESVAGLWRASGELCDVFSLIEGVIGLAPIKKLSDATKKIYRRCGKIQSLDGQIALLLQVVDSEWDPSLLDSLKDKQVRQVGNLHTKVQAKDLDGCAVRFELLEALVVAAFDRKQSSVLMNPYFESVSRAQKRWEQLDPEDFEQVKAASLQLASLRSQSVFLQELGLLETVNETAIELETIIQSSSQMLEIEGLLCRAERRWAKKPPNREHQLKLVAKMFKLGQQGAAGLQAQINWAALLKVRS